MEANEIRSLDDFDRLVGTGVIPVDQVIDPLDLVHGEVPIGRDINVTVEAVDSDTPSTAPGKGEIVYLEGVVVDPLSISDLASLSGRKRLAKKKVEFPGGKTTKVKVKFDDQLTADDRGKYLVLIAVGQHRGPGGVEPKLTERVRIYKIMP